MDSRQWQFAVCKPCVCKSTAAYDMPRNSDSRVCVAGWESDSRVGDSLELGDSVCIRPDERRRILANLCRYSGSCAAVTL